MQYTAEAVDDTGDFSYDLQNKALWFLFLFMGIAPLLLFALVIVWEKHWNKHRQEDAEHDVNPSKVVEPLRERHLVDSMKNFTIVSMESLPWRVFAMNFLLLSILTNSFSYSRSF